MPDNLPLGFLLLDNARLLRARFDRVLDASTLDLTAGEARALCHIAKHQPARQNALAQRMGVEPMTMVRFLDRLEAAGLVRREADPADRRAKRVRITAEAEPVVAHVTDVMRIEREQVTSHFSAEELTMLNDLLSRLRERLVSGLSDEEI